ncbi:unnamed protein product [Chrysodeixis includens]|uniref:Uncharacterized protein n=1 Tax=Chrysodeixis includens TaxID=689277 RepID=A0A9P0BSB7_CHRIL|nr:unnamed protein product [Chrysodeixis includens]
MFATNTMLVTAGLLALVVAGSALPGEPFLRYDPVLFSINPDLEARSNEPVEELGVDFVKLPDDAAKGYKLYKFVKQVLRRREHHAKTARFPYKPLLNMGFLDMWVDRIPAPDLQSKQGFLGADVEVPRILPVEEKAVDFPQEPLEVIEPEYANCTQPKLFFNFLFTYYTNVHYVFFFAIEHDNSILANLYYIET